MAKDVEHLKDRVLNLLRFDSNELKPLKSKRIQYHFGMNDAEVRETVRLLRLDCHPIASGSKGFFYATKAKTPSLVEDVQTPSKAKKIDGMYPSVTTLLGIIVDDFINNIKWNTGVDGDNAIVSSTCPHSEITWAKVKEEMDKL